MKISFHFLLSSVITPSPQTYSLNFPTVRTRIVWKKQRACFTRSFSARTELKHSPLLMLRSSVLYESSTTRFSGLSLATISNRQLKFVRFWKHASFCTSPLKWASLFFPQYHQHLLYLNPHLLYSVRTLQVLKFQNRKTNYKHSNAAQWLFPIFAKNHSRFL